MNPAQNIDATWCAFIRHLSKFRELLSRPAVDTELCAEMVAETAMHIEQIVATLSLMAAADAHEGQYRLLRRRLRRVSEGQLSQAEVEAVLGGGRKPAKRQASWRTKVKHYAIAASVLGREIAHPGKAQKAIIGELIAGLSDSDREIRVRVSRSTVYSALEHSGVQRSTDLKSSEVPT